MSLLNSGIRFILEICMIAAVGYWGFYFGSTTVMKWILGIGVPILFMFIWGMFGSPAAPFKLEGLAHMTLEITLFVVAALALLFSQHPLLAGILFITAILNRIFLTE